MKTVTHLVLCPLRKELTNLLAALKPQPEKLSSGKLPYWQIGETAFALCGHGKTQAGIQAGYWIKELNPQNVILCGAGGRLDSELKIADVVVASETIEHDYNEKFDSNAKKPRFEQTFCFEHNQLTGAIASGDEDIISKARADELIQETEARVVAWEGAGVARACLFYEKKFVEIRGVSDFADSEATHDFKTHLQKVMKEIADKTSQYWLV